MDALTGTAQPYTQARTTPSLFDLTERLEHSLRSRHVGRAWLSEVEAKLHAYRACLQRHVIAAEGDRGWIAALRNDDPRMEPLARRARGDFARLDRQVLTAMATVRQPTRQAPDIRHDVRDLIELTRHHRARCARLVHEAFVLDLGVA